MSLQTTNQQTMPGRVISVPNSTRPGKPAWSGPSAFGYAVILIFFGGLGGWAALAPLASGVNVIGTIEVDAGVKTVQHLEGGIVQQIFVKEGDRISQGQILVRLDPLRTDAQSVVERSGLISLISEKARLQAEIAGEDSIKLDAELTDALSHPVYGKIVESELSLFDERKESRAKRRRIWNEQLAQIDTELRSYDIRMATTVEALTLIEEELSSVQELFDKRLTTKSRVLALKRAKSGLDGQRGTLIEAIAQTKQKMTEQKLAIEAALQNERTSGLGRLNDLDPEISRRREVLNVLQDQKSRIDVKAPVDGRVMNLLVKTEGQVVGGGAILMEVVPESENMVLEAKLKAQDIEQVKVGAMVQVRLTAFNPRMTPPVDGQLVRITPTTLPASGPGMPTYGVSVKLDPESLKFAIGEQQLTSGMPASGMIAVGEQTLLSYLLTPMISSFEIAMREP